MDFVCHLSLVMKLLSNPFDRFSHSMVLSAGHGIESVQSRPENLGGSTVRLLINPLRIEIDCENPLHRKKS
jgi:hypothetical protein